MTWLRGEFDAAAAYLEAATAGMAAMDQQQIETLWFQPNDPAVTAYVYLALLAMVRGDLTGAAEDLTKAAHRAEQLGFPQGQYSDAYTRFANIWLCIEADQLERAEVFVAELTEQAERHGFDLWRLVGATAQVTVEALAALSATAHVDPHALSPHIAAVTTLVDTLHKLELNVYVTFFDGVLGRLLIAAGHFDSARARLDSALRLAEDTGMHFYDAELMRLRARTHTEPRMRQADLSAALELARRQGATLFELRAALDDFEFRGRSASPGVVDAISRFPAGSAFPEVARAEEILR